ncbi:helix-turn-helix domain-containing protein [Nocardia sp. NPDC024068]|uniref:TetR/AcrR family transcriptional regulator n=1 Tax=Nocardia sp. NPDC024068 TaxID=3157197 RepID=UPI0033DB65FB
MDGEPIRRRYESLHRTAQAQETGARIARCARELFVTRGWAATTVREVAGAAGVSVPTVYAVYGNKAGLTRALADAADLSGDLPRMLAELEAAAGPAAQLAAMAGYDRRLFEGAGDVITLLRDAGRTEPELAQEYRDGRRRADGTRVEVFGGWPDGVLRPGLAAADAVDIYAALCNIDVFTVLIDERGWSPDRVEQWWCAILARELLADPAQ